MKSYTKDPNDHLDYGWDWTDRLLEHEAIVDSEWIVPSLDLIDTDESQTGTQAIIWLAGGVLRKRYFVTNRITTDQGRTFDWSFLLTIRDR